LRNIIPEFPKTACTNRLTGSGSGDDAEALKGKSEIILIDVNQQDDEQGEVDENPHDRFAFLAFFFDVICHDGSLMMNEIT
jgi:hypothetical protein